MITPPAIAPCRRRLRVLGVAALAVALLLPAHAHAVQPQEWVHTSEADFEDGEKQGTVVTNLGDIKLAIDSRTLAELPEEGSIVYDLQAIDGETYIAAGPEAKLLRDTGNGVETLLELTMEQVFALAATDDDELIVAISGEPSRLARLDRETYELETLAELSEVRYIWEVLVEPGAGGDGDAFVIATGTQGKVLRVRPDAVDPEVETLADNPGIDILLETPQANVLSLARDPSGDRYYAGTDTEGLIYRISFDANGGPQPFVVYDAPEPEIGALLVTEDGTVYAGTADAEQARPGRLEDAQADPAGRPGEPAPVEAPVEPDDAPVAPEDIPDVPPEPEPIDDPADADEEPAPALPDEPFDGDNGDNGDNGDADDPELPEDLPIEEEEELDLEPAEPTADQRDQLRREIRDRLEGARNGGELQIQPGQARPAPQRGAEAPSRAQPPRRDRRSANGNAIYRIDREGFVREVFRESVMILDMVQADDRLLVATGNQGQLYSIRPGAEEKSLIVDLDPQQITTLLPRPRGALLVGTANPAQLVQLEPGHARRGSYTSPVLDAEQISLWGMLRVTAAIPDDTSITVETRSGNVRDPEHGPWSEWSRAQSFMPDNDRSSLQPRKMEVHSPPARFIQYRLSLRGDGDATPAVRRVALAYVMPNMPPRVASLRASYPDPGRGRGGDSDEPPRNVNIRWEASDPNDDRLRYTLEYRPAGSRRFIEIADDVEQTQYEWNTRRVPDGWYELRITASDHLDNPPDMARTISRVSDPVLVDNARPRFEQLEHRVDGRRVEITGLVTDRFSQIASIGFALNNAGHYEPILPDDMVFDSTRERFSATLPDLDPGQHVVTLRARDQRGNTTYESLILEID